MFNIANDEDLNMYRYGIFPSLCTICGQSLVMNPFDNEMDENGNYSNTIFDGTSLVDLWSEIGNEVKDYIMESEEGCVFNY